ncbi:MAG: hypothetical protein ABI881_15350 [Betaproteobacteria bacterium]
MSMPAAGPLCVVYVEYGGAERKVVLPLIADVLRAVPGQARYLVVVDNAGVPADLEPPIGFDGAQTIAGSNVHREFSGWQEGVEAARRAWGIDGMTLVLANDTIARNHNFSGPRKYYFRHAFERAGSDATAAVIGEIDGVPYTMETASGEIGLYVSTYLLLLTSGALDAALPLTVDVDRIDTLLHADWQNSNGTLFRDGMPVEYRKFLERWLHVAAGGWYRAEALTQDNFGFFRGKAMSIMLEQSLSARVLAGGGRLVSIWKGDGRFNGISRVLETYERKWRVPARATKWVYRPIVRSLQFLFRSGARRDVH